MKKQTAEVLQVSLINWGCYSIQPHIAQTGCAPAVLQGWGELAVQHAVELWLHSSTATSITKNRFLLLPSELQSARGQLPSNGVDKHIWGNVRLVQANLILLNHHWQEPVSHPVLGDAAVTAQASDPACLLSIPPSSPGLSTHPCSLGFMLLRPFICIYLLLF